MSDAVMEAVASERVRLRWDYMVVTIHARHEDVLETGLREHGKNGWELTFMSEPVPNDYRCVFKRPGT